MDGTQTGGGSGGSGGNGGSQGGSPGGTTVVVQRDGGSETSRTAERADAVQGIVDRLVTRYGTMARALEVLAAENHEHRESLRQLRQEADGLKAKVPADGSFVLTADQKKVWDAIVATKVPLDKVAERLTRANELETKQAEADFAKLVEQGAATFKLNAPVLQSLLKDKGYTLELRDVIVDGKTTKVPYVRKANDDKAAWDKLDVAIENNAELKPYLPALKTLPQGGNASESGGGASGRDGSSDFVSHDMPSNSSSASSAQGGGGSGGSVVDQHLAKQKSRSERPNPLRPAPAAKK